MVDSSPLHFDAAMANREARRCGTGTSSGAARSCGTASPQDIDAQCVRRCPEGSLLFPLHLQEGSANKPIGTPPRNSPCLPVWATVCDPVGEVECVPAKPL